MLVVRRVWLDSSHEKRSLARIQANTAAAGDDIVIFASYPQPEAAASASPTASTSASTASEASLTPLTLLLGRPVVPKTNQPRPDDPMPRGPLNSSNPVQMAFANYSHSLQQRIFSPKSCARQHRCPRARSQRPEAEVPSSPPRNGDVSPPRTKRSRLFLEVQRETRPCLRRPPGQRCARRRRNRPRLLSRRLCRPVRQAAPLRFADSVGRFLRTGSRRRPKRIRSAVRLGSRRCRRRQGCR